MPEELKPPQIEELTAPKAVEAIAKEDTQAMIKLDKLKTDWLDEKVAEFAASVVDTDAPSEAFSDKVMAIHNLGNDEIRASASVSNRMLERPMNAMNEGLFDSKSKVSQTLSELRRVVEDLDPSRQGDLFAPKRLFGVIPMGSKVRDYFLKYQSSQQHLNKIMESLFNGKDELHKDNATIEQEKINLWESLNKLQQYIYLAKKLDHALEARVSEIEVTDPEKARVVKEEMLFYIRQKVLDLQTQLAVSIQGYLALDMVRKNNLELIKGVDRASTTSLSALRTAVMVSQGLANQKLVLDQIGALNTTTGNLIESTSTMLKQQSTEVHTQAASATVNVEQLQKAFNNVYAAMDAISEYKASALTSMKDTVETLTTEIEKAKTYLDRVRSEQVAEATGDLALPKPSDELKL
ncbi:MAG: toxic anion resistance protein [Trueperaceae bacterium]|nr:MAG: toxic anion resistance protein [Trueperaceae bacterium]